MYKKVEKTCGNETKTAEDDRRVENAKKPSKCERNASKVKTASKVRESTERLLIKLIFRKKNYSPLKISQNL